MKNLLLLLLFPFLILSQTISNKKTLNDQNLFFSTDLGMKLYTGNLFLGQQTFSREGVYINFNVWNKKELNSSTFLIIKPSFILSNAVSKKIQVFSNFSEPETSFYFTTKIPNILSCNINFTLEINKKINYFLSHSACLKFRVYSLFYKKGRVTGNEINSLGGFISSEENGSLPGLEKASAFSYAINYSFNKTSIISFSFFLNSDWSFKHSNSFKMYPGLGINFEKLFSFNR